MKVRTFTPSPSIASYVSHIVVLENDSMFFEAVLPLIANGYPSITFQLTDPARVLQPGRRADNLVLYGQNIRPIQLYTAGQVTVIAFFLHPYMLQPLFGYRAAEQPGREIQIEGSAELVQSLMEAGLIDEFKFIVHPVIMGSGKRFFKDGKAPVGMQLIESKTLDKGVMVLTYAKAS